ncbi:hypothetical protein PRZ48_003800 [Zasmidium cellare]|uniref:DUF7730 domain-containing protein n=1 Tax=Zasmidium cellare TaxID=395010 RepID=A0ABR0EWN4_ZASCE|nr:hypothetical protein PRZ48_003800 [Zasmidium cellare]
MVTKRRLVTVPTDTANPSEDLQAISSRNSTESPLLSLAPEIRNRIFLHALGNTTIHVFSDPKTRRLRHTVCSSDKCDGAPLNYGTKKGILGLPSPDYAYSCTRKDIRGLPLELLGTCRQIYEEAALIPFTTNCFQVDKESFYDFAYRIMAFQKRAINDMNFLVGRGIWYGPIAKHTVRGFKGLRELRVIALYDARPQADYVPVIELFAGLPLQRCSISEYREGREIQKIDHATMRSYLLEVWKTKAKDKEKQQEKVEKKAQVFKEKYETLKKKDDDGLRRAVDNGGEGSARALRRLKRQRVDDGT